MQGRIWAIGALSFCLLIGQSAQASDLVNLAKNGDIAAVTAALDAGTPVDELDGGITALYVASEQGNVDLAQLLISHGADVNLMVKLQRTPLYGAIKGGHSVVVKLLLDGGADPNQVTKLQSPLHIAAQEGCFQCVIDLVGAGAEVNALTSSGIPPIHLAKREGHEEIVAFLLDHGGGPPEVAPISPLLATAEAAAGEHSFNTLCVKCHIATAEAETSKRPNLWGVVGRARAADRDVDYSAVMRAAGGTWTFEAINAFIAHPTQTLPGTTMEFAGVSDEKERANLIVYLQSLSDAPIPLP